MCIVIKRIVTMFYVAIFVIALSFPAVLGAGKNGTRQQCSRPEVGFQCSLDCTTLGYCDEYDNWIPFSQCPSGQICVYSECVVSSICPTDPQKTSILCSDPAVKMPNLEDGTCRTYYACAKEDDSAIGYGVLLSCPTGTVFDACSGLCSVGSCPTYSPCQAGTQILTQNNRLAYVCNPLYTIWANCPNGVFLLLPNGPECFSDVNNGCANGAGSSSSTCTAAGRYPIAGTDCEYLQCYSDLSSSTIACIPGFHFDEALRECVVGSCTRRVPDLQDGAVNGEK